MHSRRSAGHLGYAQSKDQLQAYAKLCRDRAVAAYLINAPKCRQCGVGLPYEKRGNKFCNQKCAALFTNPLRKKQQCHTCGEKVLKGRKYCTKCFVHGNKILRIEDARTDHSRRRLLIEECGHQCQMCQNTLWNGDPIPIELDHVDGNSDNNARMNLRLLCPNCHAQTPTYKSRNRGRCGVKRKQKRHRQYAQLAQ